MANSFIKERQSQPPGPPAPFVPPLDSKADPRLLADHERLRPEDRFRGVAQPHPGVSPAAHYSGIPPQVALGSKPATPEQKALHANYPSYRYHKTAAPKGVVVQDPDHEQEVCKGPGWQRFPFPPDKVASTAERLDLLESIMQVLADEVEVEGEEPLEVLERIISERDQAFADLAKAAANSKPAVGQVGTASQAADDQNPDKKKGQ